MPSVKPRLALTLPEHRHDLLKRLAALQGVSMASVVTDLLEECFPVLERVVVALEAAKLASESAKEGLRESCDKAAVELEPYRDAVLNQFDLFMDGLTASATASGAGAGAPPSGAGERAPGASRDRLNPRVVTRGSGLPTPPTGKQVKTPRNPSVRRISAK